MRSGSKGRQRGRATPSFVPDPLGTKGGLYQPLSSRDVARIYHAALDVLETTGLKDATETVRSAAIARGCKEDHEGRLRFPKPLVEDIISGAERDFTLHGQTPGNDIQVQDGHVHFATG